jgi:DNA-binding MarR family transcriptional regulator
LRRLWRLNRALEVVSVAMERTVGVTAQQRLLLRIIQENPSLRAGEIAGFLYLDRGTVSASLKRLEHRGLVKRERDALDGRAQRLSLTREGEAVCAAAELTVEATVRELLASTSEDELDGANAVMARLTRLLERAAST